MTPAFKRATAVPRVLLAEAGDVLARAVDIGLLGPEQLTDLWVARTESEVTEALKAAEVAILDASLPWLDIVAVCTALRRRGSGCFILVTGLAASEADRVEVLDAGADDCLSAPAGVAELMARIRAMLRRWRRTLPDDNDRTSDAPVSAVVMQPWRRTVSVMGCSVPLTRREYDLLELLLANPGRVLTRTELLRTIWGRDSAPGKPVDVTVARIRRKFAEVGAADHIATVRGIGFRADARVPVTATDAGGAPGPAAHPA